MEKIVGIIDSSTHFAISFANFLNERRAIPYRAMAFTELSAYQACVEEYDTELLVVSEEYLPQEGTLPKCPIIWLTEKGTDPERDMVNRYHGADRLLKEILTRLSSVAYTGNQDSQVRLTAIYTPVGGSGQTTVALAYAANVSRGSRVLYLNLEECAGLSGLFHPADKDLSDALYYYIAAQRDPQECKTKVLSCVEHFQDFDYFTPSICGEDIAELSPEELLGFLGMLQDPTLYDEIVLDLGPLVKRPWDIIRNCSRIIVPLREKCSMGERKLADLREYLDKSEHSDLIPRLQVIEIPYLPQIEGREITKELLELPDWIRILKGVMTNA